MKFVFPCDDADFSKGKISGVINGGTSYLWHLAHTLQSMGHEAELVNNGTEFPRCDVIMIQSEWYGMDCNRLQLQEHRKRGGKLIVILGHFIGGPGRPYYDPNLIEADLFVTTWKGPLVDDYKEKVHFMPHAYCPVCDKGGENHRGDLIWVGNNYSLRQEDWFSGLGITRINGLLPNELNSIYRAAKVCVNLHGSFQKGEVSTLPSTLSDKPGYALNERFWQILGSGGCMVTDFNPQILDFFDEHELIMADNKEEYQEKVNYYLMHPEEGKKLLQKARNTVRRWHTYNHRINNLLKWL